MQGSYSEKVLKEILSVRNKNRSSLFDACLAYCEKEGLDVEDLAESLDSSSKELLRQSAIEERLVTQKVAPRNDVLIFE